MNIDQYRALIAQEEAGQAQQEVEQPTEAEVNEPDKVDEVEIQAEETKEELVEIDGEKLTVEELKNGYLRQSDYTKKTQEVARTRKENEEALRLYDTLKQNPNIVQQLQSDIEIPRQLDPTQAKVVELEEKMYDMILEREIESLQTKYKDFEIREVLELASQKEMTNLEDAYLLLKSSKAPVVQSTDVETMKENLRNEILQELKAEKNTKSIITPSGSELPNVQEVTYSPSELKVAKNMGMDIKEYIKWRDA